MEMLTIGKKYYMSPNAVIAEIIGIHPAGQVSGRREHEYELMINGVNLLLTRKKIEMLFTETPPIVKQIQKEPIAPVVPGKLESISVEIKELTIPAEKKPLEKKEDKKGKKSAKGN